ncbi:DUF814 domain-containing protein [Candidatus Micrarchaeota archaeon]|nr:DUF814 domain-containing protein [Candidatus Micrarchaeota archaeon]
MNLTLFYNKSVHENAAHYYQLAKESREKTEGVKKAIEETKKEMAAASKSDKNKKQIKMKRERSWYEKFHFASTGEGKLMIGGRNAQQNDQLFSKHTDQNDLFFHADIQGASALIVKGGAEASEQEKLEAAQFAACFSNAWKNGNASVDVYCVKPEQVSKHSPGGFIAAGAFAITGERQWFRATKLMLRIGIGSKGTIEIVPALSKTKLEKDLSIVPTLSGKDKGAIAKSLSKRFGVHSDEFLQILPNGKTKTLELR